jgi:hypothetical protein
MITWEPFTASFSGKLTSFTTAGGHRVTIAKNQPNMVKGQSFMLEIEVETNRVRFLPVLMPPYWIGVAR